MVNSFYSNNNNDNYPQPNLAASNTVEGPSCQALWEFWVEAKIPLLTWLNLLNHLALLTAYYDVINNSYVTWLVRTNKNCSLVLETCGRLYIYTYRWETLWSLTLRRSVRLENLGNICTACWQYNIWNKDRQYLDNI